MSSLWVLLEEGSADWWTLVGLELFVVILSDTDLYVLVQFI